MNEIILIIEGIENNKLNVKIKYIKHNENNKISNLKETEIKFKNDTIDLTDIVPFLNNNFEKNCWLKNNITIELSSLLDLLLEETKKYKIIIPEEFISIKLKSNSKRYFKILTKRRNFKKFSVINDSINLSMKPTLFHSFEEQSIKDIIYNSFIEELEIYGFNSINIDKLNFKSIDLVSINKIFNKIKVKNIDRCKICDVKKIFSDIFEEVESISVLNISGCIEDEYINKITTNIFKRNIVKNNLSIDKSIFLDDYFIPNKNIINLSAKHNEFSGIKSKELIFNTNNNKLILELVNVENLIINDAKEYLVNQVVGNVKKIVFNNVNTIILEDFLFDIDKVKLNNVKKIIIKNFSGDIIKLNKILLDNKGNSLLYFNKLIDYILEGKLGDTILEFTNRPSILENTIKEIDDIIEIINKNYTKKTFKLENLKKEIIEYYKNNIKNFFLLNLELPESIKNMEYFSNILKNKNYKNKILNI